MYERKCLINTESKSGSLHKNVGERRRGFQKLFKKPHPSLSLSSLITPSLRVGVRHASQPKGKGTSTHVHSRHDSYSQYNSKTPAVHSGKESSVMASIRSWLIHGCRSCAGIMMPGAFWIIIDRDVYHIQRYIIAVTSKTLGPPQIGVDRTRN